MKRILATILFLLLVLSPLCSDSYAEMKYTDPETGVSFTIPDGWNQRPFMKEREFLKIQFATEDGAIFQFGFIDFYAVMYEMLAAEERETLKRTEFSNDSLTAEIVGSIIDQPTSSISVAQYSNYEYFSFLNTGEHTFMRMDNGYIFIFQYGILEIDNAISQQRKNECAAIMNSVTYPEIKTEETPAQANPTLTDNTALQTEKRYIDYETGVSFTIPEGWEQQPLSEDYKTIKAQFVAGNDARFSYGFTDLYATMPEYAKASITRAEITNDFFTTDDIGALMNLSPNIIMRGQYSGLDYYYANLISEEGKGTGKVLLRIENGYMYSYTYTVYNTSVSFAERTKECEAIMNSISYSGIVSQAVSGISALAEGEDTYVGLWQITGQQDGDTYTAYADMGVTAYLDFMPNGAIYAVMTDGEDQMADYMAYKVTGENTLDIYEGDDPLPSVYDPATGIISVTDPDGGLVSYVERVTADPLPDIRALVDNSQEEQTYYGYKMTQGDQTIDMLQMLPAMGLDPRDFYLELEPDGTGYLQFGDEETSSEITWTETEMTADGESVPYTREGDHIVISIEGSYTLELAPEGEVEALMAMMGVEIQEEGDDTVDVDLDAVAGEWKLAKASAMGQELTVEQIQAQGLDLAFRFNADGSAVMISKGEETDGINWREEDGGLVLYVGTYDMFTFTYDGEYLILSVGAKLYFEKVS